MPTGFDLLKKVEDASLRKNIVLMRVDGVLKDLDQGVSADQKVEWVERDSDDGLYVIRHSTAHLLAQAVKRLFPETQVTIGPVIENGFYYDFFREQPFVESELALIEKEMKKLAKSAIPIKREELTRDQTKAMFAKMGEDFKTEIIDGIDTNEILSIYTQDDFTDLCRGPHVPNTRALKAFKLTKVSASYWRGDSQGTSLQRIYGTAWSTQEQLEEYLQLLEEQGKRDHRKIAKIMDLYHIQPEAPGMMFWHPNGWTLYQTLEQYMREYFKKSNYHEIKTPQLVNQRLWEESGHWAKFKDDMFTLESDNTHYAIKPMSCPCHIQVFNKGIKSYKDLPYRLAEFGHVHRYEASGALHGLMRVRSFVQDDGHIFCEPKDIDQEVSLFIDQVIGIYKDFGFDNVQIRFSTRPEKRVGSDELWDKAETALQKVIDDKGIDWILSPGEGAFYGPKLEFSLTDCIGRVWQCGTIQVDFSMPERLGATFISSENKKEVPVMLHRAIFGSVERFIGILIENTYGWLPLWLAPIQGVVLPISEKFNDYGIKVRDLFSQMGMRVELDTRDEKVSYKIREHTMKKVSCQFIVGQKEMDGNFVTMRERCGKQTQMNITEVEEWFKNNTSEVGH